MAVEVPALGVRVRVRLAYPLSAAGGVGRFYRILGGLAERYSVSKVAVRHSTVDGRPVAEAVVVFEAGGREEAMKIAREVFGELKDYTVEVRLRFDSILG